MNVDEFTSFELAIPISTSWRDALVSIKVRNDFKPQRPQNWKA